MSDLWTSLRKHWVEFCIGKSQAGRKRIERNKYGVPGIRLSGHSYEDTEDDYFEDYEYDIYDYLFDYAQSDISLSDFSIDSMVIQNYSLSNGERGETGMMMLTENKDLGTAEPLGAVQRFQFGGSSLARTPTEEMTFQNNLLKSGKVLDSEGVIRPAGEATEFLGSKRLQLQNGPYQPVRNTSATIGERDYSAHALDQMQNRGIMPSVVENTIQNGLSKPGKYVGSTQYFDSVNNVRVIVNSETGRVITVIPGVK